MIGNDERLPDIFNIAAYLLEANLNRENGKKIVFYYQDKTYTYAQLGGLVKRSAKLFLELGLERENRIGILLSDRPEFVIAFLGAIWMGAVPVPINPASSLEDIHYILEDSRIKILLTSDNWQTKLQPITSKFLRHVLLVDSEQPFLSLLEQQKLELTTYAETSGDEAAFWLYTSGSTGKPKGVIHAHHSMAICAQQYAQATLGLNENDITYSVASMAFAYGLGNSLYFPMAIGAASILSDATNVFDIIDDIRRYRPTIFFGIPSIYAGILDVEEIARLESSSLRLCVSAAERLPKSIWRKWLSTYNLEICEGIGTTEFLHIFLSNQLEHCKPGSSGRPVPGYDVQIVDENGMPCPVGEIGELQVEGESLMLGYWNRLQQTRKVVQGNTMRTGDKYKRDRDDFFWFMGRADDLFKVNGQWISPLEIEEVLHQHPQISEVAVVAESDEGDRLPQIAAYISLKPGQQPWQDLENSIRVFAKQKLSHFKTPKIIRFLDSLPRTSTGKIHRHLLKKNYGDLVASID